MSRGANKPISQQELQSLTCCDCANGLLSVVSGLILNLSKLHSVVDAFVSGATSFLFVVFVMRGVFPPLWQICVLKWNGLKVRHWAEITKKP